MAIFRAVSGQLWPGFAYNDREGRTTEESSIPFRRLPARDERTRPVKAAGLDPRQRSSGASKAITPERFVSALRLLVDFYKIGGARSFTGSPVYLDSNSSETTR